MPESAPEAAVVVLVGDPVITDARAREILGAWLPSERQQLDLSIVRAGSTPLQDALIELRQVGMFDTGRVLWIRNLGAESPEETKDLLAVLEGGLPTAARLIATTERIDQRTRLFKWLNAHATIEDHTIATDRWGRALDEDLDRFIRARLRIHGFENLAGSVIAEIRHRAGGSIGALAQELDKLSLACAARRRITLTDVQDHVRDLSEAWVFTFTDALSSRNGPRALELLERLLEQGEPPLRLVAVLGNHVADLLAASRWLDRIPPQALRNAASFARKSFPQLPIEARNRFRSGFRAYYVFRGAAGFERRDLRRLYNAIVECDLQLKRSRVDPIHKIATVVFRACAAARADAELP